MQLIVYYEDGPKRFDLSSEQTEQLRKCLSLEGGEGLTQAEQDERTQTKFDSVFNRPDYNNKRKLSRHTASLGITNRGCLSNEDDTDTDEPLMDYVADDRIFREDELALEERDSYESICRQIRSALRDKPKWAEAFISVYMDGVSVNDYAASIGVSDASVVSHWLKRAKEKLKKFFKDRQI